jgi:hypothetical protein
MKGLQIAERPGFRMSKVLLPKINSGAKTDIGECERDVCNRAKCFHTSCGRESISGFNLVSPSMRRPVDVKAHFDFLLS